MKFCNYCSYICEENHKCKEEKVKDILLTVVGGEIGLVKKILDMKQEMEYEEIEIKFGRFDWLEIYRMIKKIKIVNKLNKKLEIYFKPNNKYSPIFYCELELKNPIKLKKNNKLLEKYFKTFDIPLAKFYTRRKTNYSMEFQIKNHIKHLNKIHTEYANIWDF